MKITSDMIVAFGLVFAMVLNIVLGGESQITMTIATGLIGWLGKITFWPSVKGDNKGDNEGNKGVEQK